MSRRIVHGVDEYLGRATIGNRKRKGYGASRVRHASRIVGNRSFSPYLRNLRVTVDAELRPSILNHTIEPRLIVITCLNQIVEMIDTIRRPVPVHLHDEIALACLKPHL